MLEKRKIINDILGSSRRVNDEHLFHCPYCGHHKRKMSINFAKNAFKCWVCDTRGKNIYRIVRKFGSYQQKQKWLKLDGRLDLSEFDNFFMQVNNEDMEETIDLPIEFISLCNKHLPLSSRRAFDYLYSRGVTKEDIMYWKIGYCEEGRYGGRVIIPSFNNDGNVNYFISRSYVNHKRKYLNPVASKDIVFNELYVDWDEPVVLVEGAFDAIVAGKNAIPVLGSTLRSESRLFQAIVINDTPVYLAFDEDAQKKTNYIIKKMLKYDIDVYLVDTSEVEDVGSMTYEQFNLRKNNAMLVDHDTLFYNRFLGGFIA